MSPAARTALGCAALLALLSLAAVSAAGHAPAAAQAGPDPIVVELDQRELDVGPGEKLSFVSTVRNEGSTMLEGYVAHLNVLTTDEDVYVDPEDWSPERTQYLEPLPAGRSAELSWSVQAVTSGPLILYVSVTSPDTDAVVSSGPLELTVHGQRVVDSAGVAPVVLWTPAGVLLLLGAAIARRRRHR